MNRAHPAGEGIVYRGVWANVYFDGKYVVDAQSGCWIWKSKPDQNGYGRYRFDSKLLRANVAAHRVSYLLHIGNIPEGLVIDHVCRVRNCVNPEHLEVVSQKENVRRSNVFRRRQRLSKGDRCREGHTFEGQNVMARPSGGRRCRKCHNAQKRRHTLRKKMIRISTGAA
jgi:HNH endonuclease